MFKYYNKNNGRYENTSKEERATELYNVICPKCGYQNHYFFAKKYGRCNLCKTTIDKDYFKKMTLINIRRLNNG